MKIKNLYQAFKKYRGIIYLIDNLYCVYYFCMSDFGYLEEYKQQKIQVIKYLDNTILCKNIDDLKPGDLHETFKTLEEAAATI